MMKECQITLLRGESTTIDGADFDLVSQHRWYLNNGYAVARIGGKPTCMHVFLIGRAPSGYHIDHINRNKLDNRRANLRIVTAAENLRNRRTYQGRDNPFFGKTHSMEYRIANAEKHAIPINQMSLDGSVIRSWPSAMDAQRELGISNGNINSALNGNRKTAGGFLWRKS